MQCNPNRLLSKIAKGSDTVKLKNRVEKILKLNNVNKALLIGFVLCMLVLVGVSGVSLAKYYAKRDNKGVSVASGLYFNSNCISNVKGEINTPLDQIDLLKVPGYVNPEGGSNFYLDVRNYDNHLLYNELYLDLEYTISFMKLNGETASVEYIDELGRNVRVSLEDGGTYIDAVPGTIHEGWNGTYLTLTKKQLLGGAARYHNYVIRTTNAVDGTDAKVLVMAYPTSPDYVAVAAEDMRLIGVLQAKPKNVKVGIDRSEFLIEETTEYGTNWKSAVEKMSGLVYTIQTNGDDVSTSGAVKGELQVIWDAKMLDINQFDPYYLEAAKNGTITTDGDKKTMKIKVLPYANVRITFYKTADFVSAFESTMTQAEFESLVKAELATSDD